MYEQQTYDAILNRMLARVPGDVDKREGSIIYDALAPAAAELAQMYAELDINYSLSFADTATGEYLSRRTAEHGVNRKPATVARRLGLFYADGDAPKDVPIGTRLSISGINYAVTERLDTGQFELTCEAAGIVGNQHFGTMLPIDYVAGLARAELADVRVPGQEEETDEALRARFVAAINEQPFGGNVADYLQKVGDLGGVGGVKVFPTWDGGGTVKCTIIDSNYDAPASGLVDEVQAIIDPEINGGEGLGYAPIGHSVTIAGVQAATIDVETTITLQSGYTIGQVEDDITAAIAAYLLLLRQAWASETGLIVRVAQLESRVLGVEGVADITGTTLNEVAANAELGIEEIPVLGTVTLNE